MTSRFLAFRPSLQRGKPLLLDGFWMLLVRYPDFYINLSIQPGSKLIEASFNPKPILKHLFITYYLVFGDFRWLLPGLGDGFSSYFTRLLGFSTATHQQLPEVVKASFLPGSNSFAPAATPSWAANVWVWPMRTRRRSRTPTRTSRRTFHRNHRKWASWLAESW